VACTRLAVSERITWCYPLVFPGAVEMFNSNRLTGNPCTPSVPMIHKMDVQYTIGIQKIKTFHCMAKSATVLTHPGCDTSVAVSIDLLYLIFHQCHRWNLRFENNPISFPDPDAVIFGHHVRHKCRAMSVGHANRAATSGHIFYVINMLRSNQFLNFYLA